MHVTEVLVEVQIAAKILVETENSDDVVGVAVYPSSANRTLADFLAMTRETNNTALDGTRYPRLNRDDVISAHTRADDGSS